MSDDTTIPADPAVTEPVESDAEEDYSPPPEELFHHVTRRIRVATQAAMPSSPPYDPSNPEPFVKYWRTVFDKVHDEVVADGTIPEYTTHPPSTKFEIRLFNEPHPGYCPCLLPIVDPGLALECPDGVKKGDLVRGIRDWLYGDIPPVVNGEAYESSDASDAGELVVETEEVKLWSTGGRSLESLLYDHTEVRKRVVVYDMNWEGGASGAIDEVTGVRKRYCYGEYPEIYFYGCPVEEYEELTKRYGGLPDEGGEDEEAVDLDEDGTNTNEEEGIERLGNKDLSRSQSPAHEQIEELSVPEGCIDTEEDFESERKDVENSG